MDGFLACDVEIASPEASGAGLDCMESMRVRKLEHHGERVVMELEEQNVRYTPPVLSCYGRRSSVLTALLRAASQQAESLVRRWELAVAVEVWRRTAMMVRRCLPRPGEVGPDTAWTAVLGEADAFAAVAREACVVTCHVGETNCFLSFTSSKRVKVRVRVGVSVRVS